jgi:hypothetical protein
MKTLKDVAGLYRTLAQNYMINGPWRPVYKTGNLYNRIGSYNTVSQMIKENTEGIVVLELNFAPPGATYGYFAETGTGTHSRIGPRPFAEYAANDYQLNVAINEYMETKVEGEVTKMGSQLDVIFGKLFNKK